MYKCVLIDTEHNRLVCDPSLVGTGELVEIYERDHVTPPQLTGKILKKIKEPNTFEIHTTFDSNESLGKVYVVGEKCLLRVVEKNLNGTRKRRFSNDEKIIVDNQHSKEFKEIKIRKAKTGSIRSRRKK